MDGIRLSPARPMIVESQADLEPLLSGVTIDSLEAALRLPGGPAVIRALIQEPRTPWVVRGGEMAPTHPLDEQSTGGSDVPMIADSPTDAGGAHTPGIVALLQALGTRLEFVKARDLVDGASGSLFKSGPGTVYAAASIAI